MAELKTMQKVASVNFRKWRTDPKVWIIMGVILIFAMWNLGAVLDYSVQSGIGIAPWILPHFFSMQIMVVVYGFLTVAFYSDAPFEDHFSQFMRARVGKKIWIQGQIVYIVESAMVYVMFYLLATILVILPRMSLTMEWGNLITQLAYNGDAVLAKYGISLSGIYFYSGYLEMFTPLESMALTIFLMWLVSSFMGMLIFTVQILFGNGYGMIAGGFLTFLGYFSTIIGLYTFGERIFRYSPINWICPGYLDWSGRAADRPGVYYVLLVLIWGIVIMAVVGRIAYCRKDGLSE